jgi:hypothetical protein
MNNVMKLLSAETPRALLLQAILGTTQLQVTATGGGQTQTVHLSVTLQ